MKKYLSDFTIENKPERLIGILFNWKLWILGGIVGALLGAGIYTLFPPKYRAEASVIVDQNIEEAFYFFEDRKLFTFMHRETEKLESVAWSDDVLLDVSGGADKIDIEELRDGMLQLTYAQDGAWFFYADDQDPEIAEVVAGVWAEAFIEHSYAAVEISAELEVARDALEDFIADNPDAERRDINLYLADIRVLQESTKGISQYIDLAPNQITGLSAERVVGLGAFIIIGAILFTLALFLVLLFIPFKGDEENV